MQITIVPVIPWRRLSHPFRIIYKCTGPEHVADYHFLTYLNAMSTILPQAAGYGVVVSTYICDTIWLTEGQIGMGLFFSAAMVGLVAS